MRHVGRPPKVRAHHRISSLSQRGRTCCVVLAACNGHIAFHVFSYVSLAQIAQNTQNSIPPPILRIVRILRDQVGFTFCITLCSRIATAAIGIFAFFGIYLISALEFESVL